MLRQFPNGFPSAGRQFRDGRPANTPVLAVKSEIGAPPEFRIAKHASTKMWSAPRIGGVRIMRLLCGARRIARPTPFVWPKSGAALGFDPRDIPLQALPVHGFNRCLECYPKSERRRRSGTPKKENGFSLLILRLAEL
jgi:hypothetical protein